MDVNVLSKTKMEQLARVGQRKFRMREGIFAAEGEKCALDMLGKFDLLYLVASPRWIETHPGMAMQWQSQLLAAADTQLHKLSNLSNPPEVIAYFRIPDTPQIPTVKLPRELYLVLDGVQDPGNMGTIIRTAHWFGIKRIFCSSQTVDIYNPKTVIATMGSLADVEVCYCHLPTLLQGQSNLPVYGLQLEGEDIYSASLDDAGFICMGSEGHGLSEEVKCLLTHPLTIPPYSHDSHPESLNVGIATAITLALFRR